MIESAFIVSSVSVGVCDVAPVCDRINGIRVSRRDSYGSAG